MYIGFFDGGSKGNPGVAGGGWVLKDPNHNFVDGGTVYVGDNNTNNEAEYDALIALLEYVDNHRPDIVRLHVYGDSMLVIKQCTRKQDGSGFEYRCLKTHLQSRQRSVMLHMDRDNFCLTLEQVPREKNVEADDLANLAMETRTTQLFGVKPRIQIKHECHYTM